MTMHTADLRPTQNALNKACENRGFEFSFNGVDCVFKIVPDGEYMLCAPFEHREWIEALTSGIEDALHQDVLKDVRQLDCLRFVKAFIEMNIDICEALNKIGEWEYLNAKDIDISKLSLKEQCMIEVLEERAKQVGEGELGSITMEMVNEKMKQKQAENQMGSGAEIRNDPNRG